VSTFDDLLAQEYPQFSQVELARRRALIEEAMAVADVDHLLCYGIGTRGGAIGWLSQWVVTNEAQLVLTPGEENELFVQYFNHVPLATHLARDTVVAWGGASTIATSVAALQRRGAKHGRVGVMGPLPLSAARQLEAAVGPVKDLTAAYNRLRLKKSEEELRWFALGASFGDRAIAALEHEAHVGMSERELGALVESTWLPLGGVNALHYFAVNDMNDPQYCVPRQHPSTRVLRHGDVVTTEITANFFEYGGQILRTFAVAAELTPLYRDLHDVADAAFAAISALLVPGTSAEELVEASGMIEEAGFTTLDDLVHGYGGGYLAPILGSRSRPNEPTPDFVLEESMMLVVQPNVVTTDHHAGVQTGECLVVTAEGPRRLHHAARGARRIG
jgi:Xaa-Pro aminopeptidase